MTTSELLRRAVDNQAVPRDLHGKVRAGLEERRWRARWTLSAALACVGLVLIAGQAYTTSLLRVGLADHIQCALRDSFPRQASSSEMAAATGRQFAGLIRPISEHSGGLRLISAHQCDAVGRSYVHFVLSGKNGVTSVSITKRRPFEWIFWREERKVERWMVAGFEYGDYLVYVSSSEHQEELASSLPAIVASSL